MSSIAELLGSALGSLMLPFPVVWAVIHVRRRQELAINKRRLAAWFCVALLVMAVFHAISRAFGASGELAGLLLALPVPIAVSWFAVMLASEPRQPPAQLTPADEMRAIRPK